MAVRPGEPRRVRKREARERHNLMVFRRICKVLVRPDKRHKFGPGEENRKAMG